MVEINTGMTYTLFDAIAYKEQVVAGTNYEVKYSVGADEFLVVKIFQPLQSAENNNPQYKELVSDSFEKGDQYYGAGASIIKATMLASAAAAALILA